jgi:hypothetical protein
LSPIIVIPENNGNLGICTYFRKLNATTKKDPYPLPFTNKILKTIIGYEAYFFLNRYSIYHKKIIPYY